LAKPLTTTEIAIDRTAVRGAFRRWDSTQGLGDEPLARLSLVESRRKAAGYRPAAVGRGLALRDVLRGPGLVRPSPGEPDPADVRWRSFVIVSEQYLAGRKPDYVAEQLHMARSTFDHEQAAALDHLADVLSSWDEVPPPELAPAAAPAAVPLMAPPRQPDGLTGRAEIFTELRSRLIAGKGDISLHGLPGVGKTALAVELAHDRAVRQALPDGVLWAGLGRRPDLASQLALWGAAIGVSLSEFAALPSTDDRARLVHTLLGRRRALLVVDDVWDPAAGLAFRLGGEGCVRLFTCRSGAIASTLAPDGAVHLGELDDESGVRLLQRSIGTADPIQAAEARRLVAAVGAHPLALVLAGRYLAREGRGGHRHRQTALARLAEVGERFKIEKLAHRLDQQPSSFSRETPISLETVIGLSVDELAHAAGAAPQAWFPPRPGTFTEPAALAASGQDEAALHELVDSGLVEPSGEDRFSLHPVVSDYARSRSDPGAERLAGGFSDWQSRSRMTVAGWRRSRQPSGGFEIAMRTDRTKMPAWNAGRLSDARVRMEGQRGAAARNWPRDVRPGGEELVPSSPQGTDPSTSR
jgi:hypothetical protein